MTEVAGKYLDDETLNELIEEWGDDLSFRARENISNIAEPRDIRDLNRRRMIEAATVYTGLRMLWNDRVRGRHG